jgi:trans-2,3-dihydro-3-hydroxyanthranilate isomerase
VLDLQVGKIPVDFSIDAAGHSYGEMHQIDPEFGESHDRHVVAALAGIRPDDIVENVPIQSVSTGLSFAVVPLKSLKALQSIKPDLQKIREYFGPSNPLADFYYITRDTQDPTIGIRSRAIFLDGEDPATGSASGSLAAWMVRNGMAKSGEKIHIQQGVEIKRPSQIFASAEKVGDKIQNVRVGGNAVEVLRGEYSL